MEHAAVTVIPTPPYDFDLTAAYATYFRGQYGAESFQDGVFRRLLRRGDHLCLVSVRSKGTVDEPLLEVEVAGPSLEPGLVAWAAAQVGRVLGVDQELTSFYHLALKNPLLAPLVQGLWGLHVPQTASVFEALVLTVLGQQVSSLMARTLRGLLIQTYGAPMEVHGNLYYAFPQAQALSAAGTEGLRAIKFSARKAEYVQAISDKVASGELDLEGLRSQPDEAVIHTLTSLRGVGLWTAHWLLIRALSRSDGFPHSDLALQRGLGALVNGGSPFLPEEALAYSQRWSPFRSYITTYLFASLRSGRLIPPPRSRKPLPKPGSK